MPIVIARRLRNGALAIKRLKTIGIFRIIGAVAVTRLGLPGKDNNANGGKQARNHQVLDEKTRFLHDATLTREYGVRLSQSS